MRIATFWHSGRLRNMETLCLASWLDDDPSVFGLHLRHKLHPIPRPRCGQPLWSDAGPVGLGLAAT
ncbi:MAG: hypothetical protein K0B00_06695 [Rhodobacteraceae bacterium]|nr:hypothetical protein [Paracoccaceae bacterium]